MLKYPFTPVSGQGLGLAYSSLTQIGEIMPLRELGQGKIKCYFNIANGNVCIQDKSLVIKELTAEVDLTYIYNSMASPVESAWKLAAEKRFLIIPNAEQRTKPSSKFLPVLLEPDGHITTYHYDSAHNLYLAPAHANGTPYLHFDDINNNWVWYHPGTEIVEIYDLDGFLQSRKDSIGRTLTFEYENKQLSAINGPTGNRYEIHRNNGIVSIYSMEGADLHVMTQLPKNNDPYYNKSYIWIENEKKLYYFFDKEIKEIKLIDEVAFKSIITSTPKQRLTSQQIKQCISNADDVTLLITHVLDQFNRVTCTQMPVSNYKINYTYNANTAFVNSIVQTDTTSLLFDYDNNYRIQLFKAGTDNFLNVNYQSPNQVIVTDSYRLNTTFVLDQNACITSITREQGYDTPAPTVDTTTYGYSQNGQLASVTPPNGSTTLYQYDPNFGFKKSVQQPNGQRVEYNYEGGSDRPKLVTKVQYLANGTPVVTRYVYDNNYDNQNQRHCFLRFEISPEGRVKEYRPDGWGNIASVRAYTDATLDVSEIDPHIPPSLLQMQSWLQAQNPQHIALTEFIYDMQGRINRVRKYSDVDSNGNGINNDTMSEDWTWYNTFDSLLLKQTKQSSEVTTYTKQSFDDLQRIISHIDVVNQINQTTTYEYLDSQALIKVTFPNGRIKFNQLNNQSLLDNTVETVVGENGILITRETTFQRDLNGRDIVRVTADQKQHIRFYDRQNRLGFEITPQGILKEYRYSRKNNSKTVIRYAERIDPSKLYYTFPPLPGELPSAAELLEYLTAMAESKENRASYEFYDQSQRLLFQVKENLGITQYLYDTLNRQIGKIDYTTPIDRKALNQLQQGETVEFPYHPGKDSCNLTILDKDNNIIGKIDAAGYLTEFKFDAAGRQSQKIVYPYTVPLEKIIKNKSISIDDCRPHSVVGAAYTYYFYNARNQCIAEIDPRGYYTQHTYLACGLPDKTVRFANQLNNDEIKFLSTSELPQQPLPSPEDQTTAYLYDELNRVVAEYAPFNKLTNKAYDVMGKLIMNKISDVLAQGMDNIYLEDLKRVLGEKGLNELVQDRLLNWLDAVDVNNLSSQALAPDHMRAKQWRLDGWSQITAEASGYVAQVLALIDADNGLNQQQKNAAKELVWKTLSVRTTYDNTGLKLYETDAYGNITYFYYNADRKLTVVIKPQGVIQEFTLNNFNEVISSRSYYSVLTTQEYQNLTGGFISPDFQTLLDQKKDPERDAITLQARNNAGLVESVLDPEGYLTEENYTMLGQLATEHVPVADKTPSLTIEHDFDPRGFEKETRKISANLTTRKSRFYESPFGKLTAVIDEIGRESKTEYNSIGLAEKEIDPEEIVRETKAYDAFSRITALTNSLQNTDKHFYNQAKRTRTILKPDGTEETYQVNIFGEQISYVDGLGNVFTWRHEPHGKVTQYVDALHQTTQDGYDLKGRHFRHTDAKGIVTNFEYDNADNLINKIFDINSLKLKTTYIPDAWGRNKIIIDPNLIATQQLFDKRNLLVESIIDPNGVDYPGLNLTTIKTYNGQKTQVDEQQGEGGNTNQYEEAYLHDELNRSVGKTIDPKTAENPNALNITNKIILDNASQIVATQDPNGNITYTFYDKCGRARFIISPLKDENNIKFGSIKEKRYDTEGHLIFESDYHQPIVCTGITTQTTLETIEILAAEKRDSNDSQTWRFYDVNGREQFQVNSLGSVTENDYDKNSRITKKIQYATLIDSQLLATLTTQALIKLIPSIKNPTEDRVNYTLFDAIGQERFIITPKNGVTEKRYDANKKLIATIQYATAVSDPEQNSQLTPDEFYEKLTLDNLNDRYNFIFYDNAGRKQYEVDPVGKVTAYYRDNNGNIHKRCCFDQPIDSSQFSNLTYAALQQQLSTLVPNDTVDQVTRYEYDRANRVKKIINPLKNEDTLIRDALGNIKKHIDRNNNTWEFSYDRAKRKTEETTPEIEVTWVSYDSSNPDEPMSYKQTTVPIKRQLVYDPSNNQIFIVNAKGTSEERNVISFYSPFNKINDTVISNAVIDDPNAKADFVNLPIKNAFATTKTFYNAKKLPITTQNENGQWTFFIYDSEKRPLYKVNAKGVVSKYERNAFGEVIKKIVFDKPVDLNLQDYVQNGIPKIVLEEKLQPSPQDRVKLIQRDQCGNETKITIGKVFYYTPAVNAAASFGIDDAVTNKTYNIFNQCTYEQQLANPQLDFWKETMSWFDRQGQLVALAEKISKYDELPAFRVTRHYFDIFKREIIRKEFAKSVQNITPQYTLAQLDSSTQFSIKDRVFVFTYDLLGQKISERRWQITNNATAIENKKIQVNNLHLHSRLYYVRFYQYSKTGKLTARTYEDGSTEYYYYNKIDKKIAFADVPRKVNGSSGKDIILIPLTYYGINANGQRAAIIRFKLGTAAAKNTLLPPKPIDVHLEDQIELKLMDSRGLTQCYRDADKNVFVTTFTATKKIARKFSYLTNWQLDVEKNKTPSNKDTLPSNIPPIIINPIYVPGKVIDEVRNSYDALDLLANKIVLRNNNAVETTLYLYNSFNEPVAEDQGDNTWPLYKHYDNLGRLFSTNSEKGINTLRVYDLASVNTGIWKSATDDLSQFQTDSDLINIVNWDITRLERSDKVSDAFGRPVAHLLPSYYDSGTNQAQPIPLSMVVGDTFPEFGKTSITWVLPQERNVKPVFTIWPATSNRDDNSAIINPQIQTINGRCGVDVSDLTTDVYSYEIDYLFTDPNNPNQSITLYTTQGNVQFDTGVTTNSQSLVVKVTSNSTLFLTGNTTGLTAVELYQDNQPIQSVPVTAVPNTSNFTADLSNFASGVYTVKPVNAKKDVAMSLPFTIYTAIPAKAPLSREIPCEVDLGFLDTHVQLTWLVTPQYANLPVKISCDYVDVNGLTHTHQDTITPGTDKGHYTDKNGNVLVCNTEFESPILKITDLSLALVIDEANTIPLLVAALPEGPTEQDEFYPTLHYHAQLPLLKEKITLIKSNHPELRPNLYEIFGVSPRKFGNALAELVEKKDARAFLATEILQALMEGKFIAPDEKWEKLHKKYIKLKSAYDKLVSNFHAKHKVYEAYTLRDEELIDYIKKHYSIDQTIAALMEAMEALKKHDAILLRYCRTENVYLHYVHAFNRRYMPRGKSAVLYAKQHHINFYIWQDNASAPLQLQLLDYNEEPNPIDIIHVFAEREIVYFSVLTEKGFKSRQQIQLAERKNQAIKHSNLRKTVLLESKMEELDEEEYQSVDALELISKRDTQEYIVTKHFAPRLVLYIAPLKNISEQNTFYFLDTSLDRLASWKIIPINGTLESAIVIDVTKVPPGAYPFRLNSLGQAQGNFTITRSADVYPSNNFPTQNKTYQEKIKEKKEKMQEQIISPVRYQEHDRWNNKTKVTDANGNVTSMEFNPLNKVEKQTEALVNVVNEDGSVTPTCPVTYFHYNSRGVLIGKLDANNYSEFFNVNAAAQMLEHILGDGTIEKRQDFDALGRVERYYDPRNYYWQRFYNHRNQVVKIISPSGRISLYSYNELNHQNSYTSPDQFTFYYNFDPLANIIETMYPNGFVSVNSYDRNHLPLSISLGGGSLTWRRDYFGTPQNHKDLGGSNYTYTYDFKKQVVRQYAWQSKSRKNVEKFSVMTSEGPCTLFFPKEDFSGQNLQFTNASGRLMEVQDFANSQLTQFDYDRENNRIVVQMYENGGLVRNVQTTLDALNRESYMLDTQMVVNTGYDAMSNRRHVTAKLYIGSGNPIVQDLWNTYDGAQRALIDGGNLINGVIQGGIQNQYQYNLRSFQNDLVRNIWTQLDYDADSLLIHEHTSLGDDAWRTYSPSGLLTAYYTPNIDNEIKHFNYNGNNWQTGSSLTQFPGMNSITSGTSFGSFLGTGQPTAQFNFYLNMQDEFDWKWGHGFFSDEYERFDNFQLSNITGYWVDSDGDQSNLSNIKLNYNSNGNTAWIWGSHPTDKTSVAPYTTFSNTYDGIILGKTNYTLNTGNGQYIEQSYARYFYTANGRYLGSYQLNPQGALQGTGIDLNFLRNQTHWEGGREVGFMPQFGGWTVSDGINTMTVADPITPVTIGGPQLQWPKLPGVANNLLKKLDPNNNDVTFPPLSNASYTVTTGDSYGSIAQQMQGSDSYASALAVANGSSPDQLPQPGTVLNIPNFLPTKDSVRTAVPFQQLSSTIMGNLQLKFTFPPQHTSFWGGTLHFMIEALAVGVALAVAPWGAGFILGSGITTGLSFMAAEGVVGALTGALVDAAGQGLMIGMHLQTTFSWKEVAEVGIEAGFAAAFAPAKGANMWTKIFDAGKSAVGAQLTDMALGLSHQFDVRSVLAAMVGAGLSTELAKVGHYLPQWAQDELNTWSTDAVSDVLDGHGGFEVLAEQLLGSSLAQGAMEPEEYAERAAQIKQVQLQAKIEAVTESAELTILSVDGSLAKLQADIDTMDGLIDPNAATNSTTPNSSSSSNYAATTKNRGSVTTANNNSVVTTNISNTVSVNHSQQQTVNNITNNNASTTTNTTTSSYAQLAKAFTQGVGQGVLSQVEGALDAAVFLLKTTNPAIETLMDTIAPPPQSPGNPIQNISNAIKQDRQILSTGSPTAKANLYGQWTADVGGLLLGGEELLGGKLGNLWDSGLGFFKGVSADTIPASSRQIARISRVSSNVANAPFISEDALAQGWSPPYPPNMSLRQIIIANEIQFLRFFAGDKLYGGFLVRESEVQNILNDPEAIRIYLGLKEIPTSVEDVYVPQGTTMLVGRIGSQPNFGLMSSSGFQYQLLDEIPEENFQNIRPILQLENTSIYAP